MKQGSKLTYMPHLAALLLCGGLLPACSPTMDMQGYDPREYYEEHPIKNQVETHHLSEQVHFEFGANRLDNDEVMHLRDALRDISAMAADGVQVKMATSEYHNDARRKHLMAVLRSMGYSKDKISFKSSSVLIADDVQIDVQYAAIVPPNCPDWRRSPVTTYSNTTQGNFRCATETNLGAMVADPHDLVRGTGHVYPDTQRSTLVVQQYRSGQSFGQPVASTDTGSSSSSGSNSDSGSGDSPPAAQ